NWHNNHHAYPGSAKLGLLPGQVDPGWWLIRTLEMTGLAWNVRTPDNLPERPGLRRLRESVAQRGMRDRWSRVARPSSRFGRQIARSGRRIED
ncbi:hypothetical protein ABTE96_20050, partial [Acinetobacter baumannii]